MSAQVVLRGGESVAVDPDQLDRLAAQVAALVTFIERTVVPTLLRANEPATAAVLDPIGAGEVLIHSAGALSLALMVMTSWLGLAGALRAAAAGYRETDSVADSLQPLIRAVDRLPAAAAMLGRGHYQQALTADPQLVDAGVQMLTGLDPRRGWVGALTPTASAGTAAGLAELYRDGRATVTIRADAQRLDPDEPPRSVADLLRDVAVREDDDADGGAIDVRILDGPHGRRVLVDIAGTTCWDFDPLARTGQASDVGTNLRTLANEPSVLTRGVRQALRMAGVGSRDQIMLVGHSQGGMVAAELAGELSRDHEFMVTHVVTAGSPIGLAQLPGSITVLSLENRGDVVPELDGSANPARPNWLTAQVAHGDATVLGQHSINSYVAGATDVDADQDQAVKDWQSGAAGYLQATSVRTVVFHVGRN